MEETFRHQYDILNGLHFEHRTLPENPERSHHGLHTHDFCELYFYISGKTVFMVENGVYEPTLGTVIYTRPGEMHGVRIEAPGIYDRYFFHIQPEIMSAIGLEGIMRCFFNRPFGQQNTIVLSPDAANRCLLLLRRVDTLLTENTTDAGPLSFAALLELLHEVNRCAEAPAAHTENRVRSEIVNRAMQYIGENLSESFSTAELAANLYVSREYLSRQFSRHTGLTLNRFITIKRVTLAKTLLAEGHALNDVCTACGWQDYSYFISVFRREIGMTPMKYKEQFLKPEER